MKIIVTIMLFIGMNYPSNGQSKSSVLRQKIKLLQPFEGDWSAEVKLHGRDGAIVEEAGVYKISWVLDNTYLQWNANLRNKKDTNRLRNFIIMMTYNPDSARYENLYFYRASAMRVFEAGLFDSLSREYITRAFIPLEDGVRDEYVRTITSISDNNDRITYFHYSRYRDEKEETLDFEAILRRIK